MELPREGFVWLTQRRGGRRLDEARAKKGRVLKPAFLRWD
jgi:hypothetical protein